MILIKCCSLKVSATVLDALLNASTAPDSPFEVSICFQLLLVHFHFFVIALCYKEPHLITLMFGL